MTAEIAVMNKWAVALAADSKVTVSGAMETKTYDTVNKLFTLSKCHPVGIMIYGNAEFMNYPWETVIKMYRDQKGKISEATVADWAKDFFKYLRGFGKITLKDKLFNLVRVCEGWFTDAFQEAQEISINAEITWGAPESIEILREVMTAKADSFAGAWLAPAEQEKFIAAYGKLVDKVTEKRFEDFKDPALQKIAEQYISACIFATAGSPQSTGIVFAGFGDEEIFPTVIDYECDGYVGPRLKVFEKGTNDVRRTMTGAIRAFAQGDMVQRFMNGVDANLGSLMMMAFHQTLEESCLEILDTFGAKGKKTEAIKEKIRSAVEQTSAEVWSEIQTYAKANFSDPVLSMVAILPKDELANLAESLVSLTSLKRRVSSDAETVGGPIDVALISKGDGFIWIKRKHYFSPELNPQFIRSYLDNYQRRPADETDYGYGGKPGGPTKTKKAAAAGRRPRSSNKGKPAA